MTDISLFSGAGGDTLVMKNASIDVIGYVEFNKQAINTHTHNFPECKKIGEDITKIDNNTFEKYKGERIVIKLIRLEMQFHLFLLVVFLNIY